MPSTHSRRTAHVVAWLMVASVVISACNSGGGGNSNQGAASNAPPQPSAPAPPPAMVISPSSAVVPVDRTLQFQVTVNASDTLTWRVDGISGGNATIGTISSAGLYTAPATVPIPDAVRITATSG